jgi:hypothetical protein
MRNARVLPDPVFADPRTSRVWSEAGIDRVWIGVGLRKWDDFRPGSQLMDPKQGGELTFECTT